ncbi:MAG: hypothetical protein F6K42_21090 [Leptolyngbya sp. SIO1D8]|nr:hypothetical protein [Leptolyngbya sp. SIO1D8]
MTEPKLAPLVDAIPVSKSMSLPQPVSDVAPASQGRSLKRPAPKYHKRVSKSAQLRALGWEITGRLTVNLAVSLVAIATLVRLFPYYQTQRQVLHEMEASVKTATEDTKRLRADFSRYFDPTQTSQMIQEIGARESEQHIPIVLIDPLSPQANPEQE